MIIAVYLDCIERLDFFSRLPKNHGIKYYFFTTRLSIYLKCIKTEFKCKLISRMILNLDKKNEPDIIFNDSVDVCVGNQSIGDAAVLYKGIIDFLERLTFKVDFFFIWNGSGTSGKAIKKYCHEHNVKTLYFEISNLPNSIIVDPEGVNAKSSIFNDLNELDKLNLNDDFDFESWFSHYKEYKLKPLPQAANKNKYNLNFLVDYFWALSFGLKEFSIVSKWRRIFKKKNNHYTASVNADLSLDYIFLPLQVSSDSQLILNSDYDNSDLIEFAIQRAKVIKCELYIKVHPAEIDFNYLERFFPDCVSIVSNDTNELIKKSREIIVNNSTVGLEALIYNKPVKVFGRCYYKEFDGIRLRKFINRYLINDVNYFSNDSISLDKLVEILNRAR